MTPNALGIPGRSAKSSISLLSSTPVPGATRPDPYSRFTVWVTAARLPCASMIEKWVVSSSSSGVASPESSSLGVARAGWMVAQPGGVVGTGEQALRHLDEVRVAQVEGAIAIRAPHRLHHQVRALHLVEPVQFPALQDLQHLRQGDAARRRRRRGDDLPAAVAEADRLALLDSVGRQFLQGPLPAFGVHALDQLACNLAAVE